jgi:hypothetical protein
MTDYVGTVALGLGVVAAGVIYTKFQNAQPTVVKKKPRKTSSSAPKADEGPSESDIKAELEAHKAASSKPAGAGAAAKVCISSLSCWQPHLPY